MRTYQLVNASNGTRSPDVTIEPEKFRQYLGDIYDTEELRDSFYVLDVTIETDDSTGIHSISRAPMIRISTFLKATEEQSNV